MARKSSTLDHHTPKTFNVAVVGLSGSEREKGCMGVGKSCLCNRFVRPLADDYYTDHISVLSQTDFSGRVVNNDHWLYWGEVTKTLEDGSDVTFSVIEQTEFIDDSCFQPFKTGKTEPYYKRCASTRVCSAEKLMYICKNQLGIEKEYEQRYLNDGRFMVDAFLCVFDVSDVQGRMLDRAVEYTALILNNLIKTKKPVVLVTTKHDEANEYYVREAERLINRKEFRGLLPMIETSAHDNVNVDLAFITCLQMLDRTRRGVKLIPYYDALRLRKETLDFATEAYHSLIRNQITDYRAIWNAAYKKLSQSQEFLNYCDLFGQDNAHKTFKRHIKKLKDDYISRQLQTYLRILPVILNEMFPDMDSMGENGDWESVKIKIRAHPDFDQYFVNNYDKPWYECMDGPDNRLPVDLLDTPEAEQCFLDHRGSLESEDRRLEMKNQFKQLLAETGFTTPGKLFAEVRILFLGRECYESLSELDLKEIYADHQHLITERAKRNFQESLFEHSELLYHVANSTSNRAITQEDVFKINEALKDDIRFKALERLERERTMIILRHISFLHSPLREHCPSYPNCMDNVLENFVSLQVINKSPIIRSTERFLSTERNLNIVVLGSTSSAEDFAALVKDSYQTYEFDKVIHTLNFKLVRGDVNLPENSLQASNFLPQACFCVYSNHQSLEYIRDSLEKTLLSNLEQEEDRLPFHSLPMVILFAADPEICDKDINVLREEGQNRAKNLQCPFLDISNVDSLDLSSRFDENALPSALNALLESIQSRMSMVHSVQSIAGQSIIPDLRILLCTFCGDPFDFGKVMNSFLSDNVRQQPSPTSLIIDLNICDTVRFVEIIFTSYHGAGTYRDELLHGFILVYSTHRKASLTTLCAFSNNIPNTPTQIVAITDNDNPSFTNSLSPEVYYSNTSTSSQFLDEGTALAEKIQAHFHSHSSFSEISGMDSFAGFFREAWTRKPTIEKAFEMDEFDYNGPSTAMIPPPLPSREDSYNIRDGSLDYEQDLEASPPPSYSSHCSPRQLSNHQRLVLRPESGQPITSGDPSVSMYVPRRRRSAGLTGERVGYLQQPQYRFRKSNSLQTDNLYPIEQQKASCLQTELEVSDEISDDDDDTVSSELSGYGAYPPPPEPAPPDLPPNRLRKAPSLPVGGHIPPQRILDEGWVCNQMCDVNVATNDWSDNESRRSIFEHHEAPSSLSSKPLKPKPGKLNLKRFDNITDAVSRMSLSSQHNRLHVRSQGHLASENSDHSTDRFMGKDLLHGRHGYPLVLPTDPSERKHHKIRSLARRTNDPALERVSNSESDWSSSERLHKDSLSRPNRKPGSHKKNRRKRAIPVALPRLPSFESGAASEILTSQPNSSNMPCLPSSATASLDALEQANYHDSSHSDDYDGVQKAPRSTVIIDNPDQMLGDLYTRKSPDTHQRTERLQSCSFGENSSRNSLIVNSFSFKRSSSSSDAHSSNLSKDLVHDLEKFNKEKIERDKKIQREEEKNEKRRLKEEERLRRQAEKKKKKQIKSGSSSGPSVKDFAQSEFNAIPLFVEKCVQFIEEEGMESEGIYRVPGNRAQVVLLFNRFEEDPTFSIRELDIPVNAVATALKDFFSKHLPQIIPNILMDELTSIISSTNSRDHRLLALRELINKLPPANFDVLKFIFRHFVRITKNSRINSMDSKNMAICWWPTLLPYEFTDMHMFERMRPHLEEFVQTLIDQFEFIFCNEKDQDEAL
ncbi:rho GTPase-activating protein 190 isoform X2 [Brevipalpus obovatus]|uniref:rho GTPase-activating protein 190 isoform X2 n=1 Tax=Brevipalpus obovatus TaxID=246614 RepID=UPI003D9F1417